MSTFDESQVRRDGDGKFGFKPHAESDVVLESQGQSAVNTSHAKVPTFEVGEKDSVVTNMPATPATVYSAPDAPHKVLLDFGKKIGRMSKSALLRMTGWN